MFQFNFAGWNNGGSQSRPFRIQPDQCPYCNGFGHWNINCPLKKEVTPLEKQHSLRPAHREKVIEHKLVRENLTYKQRFVDIVKFRNKENVRRFVKKNNLRRTIHYWTILWLLYSFWVSFSRFWLSSKQQDFVDYEIESLLGKNSPVICKNVPTIVHPLSDAKNSHGKEMLILNLSLGMLTNGSSKTNSSKKVLIPQPNTVTKMILCLRLISIVVIIIWT